MNATHSSFPYISLGLPLKQDDSPESKVNSPKFPTMG